MARSSVLKLPRALIAMMGEEVLNDPLVGDRPHILWTLPMVLAFIKWRTLDAVRWFENGELVHRKAVPVKNGYDPSHFVSKRDLDAAEDQFGPPFNDSPHDPFTQLQWAGKDGRIAATALPSQCGDRQDITAKRWVGLRLADDVMELYQMADRAEPRHVYHHVLIEREDCLLEWWPDAEAVTRELLAKGYVTGRSGRKAIDPPEYLEQVIDLFRSGKAKGPHQAARMFVDRLEPKDLKDASHRNRMINRLGKLAKEHFSEKSGHSSD